MTRILKLFGAALLALFSMAAVAQAPDRPPQGQRAFSQAELDQMLAPIALYPDSLLSHVLAAATYPRDLYEAAAWSRTHQDLRGEEAVRAAGHERWDPAVVSLTAFPEVLAMLDERRYWTEKLGEAFIEQPEQVMDTVQHLRRRADAAGTLRSSDEMRVERRGDYYTLEPPSPEVVYVPYYDPRYAYGSWWWPDYPPVYWRPWRGYTYYPGYAGFGWGYGVALGPSFFFSVFDWPRRYVRYTHHRPWYFGHRHPFRHGDRWRWAGRDGHRDWRADGSRDWRRDGSRDWRRDGTRDGGRDWRDGRRDPPVRNQVTRPVAPALTTDGGVTQPRPQYRNQYRQDVAPLQRTPAPVERASVPRPVAPAMPSARPAPAASAASNPAARPAPQPSRQSGERSERRSDSSSNPAERGSRTQQR